MPGEIFAIRKSTAVSVNGCALLFCRFVFYLSFSAKGKAEDNTADTAYDMGQLRDIVRAAQAVQNFLSQIKDDHQNKCDGNAALFHFRERGQDDHHEDHAAGAEQGGGGEEDEVDKACDCRRDGNGQQQGAPAVFFLQRRTNQQQKKHVAHVVAVTGMTQHMAEKAYISERISQGGAIDGEELRCGIAAGHAVQDQYHQTQQSKANGYRRVETNHEFFHVNSSSHYFYRLYRIIGQM